jgi:hypothetical protein
MAKLTTLTLAALLALTTPAEAIIATTLDPGDVMNGTFDSLSPITHPIFQGASFTLQGVFDHGYVTYPGHVVLDLSLFENAGGCRSSNKSSMIWAASMIRSSSLVPDTGQTSTALSPSPICPVIWSSC